MVLSFYQNALTNSTRRGKADSEIAKASGLDRLAEQAGSPLLREIAALADHVELSLSAVARKLSRAQDRDVDPTDVRRVFEARRPRAKSVEALAAVVGMSRLHRKLASAEPLTKREVDAALTEVAQRIEQRDDHYIAGTVDELWKVLAALDEVQREQIARAFLLARERERYDRRLALGDNALTLADEADRMSAPVVRFAAALLEVHGGFDLFARLRVDIPGRTALVDLQSQLNTLGFLQRHEIDAVIALVVGMLRQRGVETDAMEESLKRKQQSATSRETTANPRKNGGAQP